MKARSVFLSLYLMLFVMCMAHCCFAPRPQQTAGYDNRIKMYRYQLDYSGTYSPVFAPRLAEAVADTTEEKTAYLTFDDGPSPRTGEILDILKEYDIKATFFVINAKEEYTPYMQRAADEGHTIGVHSASHKYKEIYASVEAYLDDFTRCYDYIYTQTEISPTIYRFPGGSVNNYNKSTNKDIIREMSRRGFVYFDWNVESSDSSNKISRDTIYNNVIKGCKGRQRAVIIMHDSIGKKSTVQALKRLIPELQRQGWVFKALTNEVKPMIFKIK